MHCKRRNKTAHPSSEKVTTVTRRVIELKCMPMYKTLVGPLLQSREHKIKDKKQEGLGYKKHNVQNCFLLIKSENYSQRH